MSLKTIILSLAFIITASHCEAEDQRPIHSIRIPQTRTVYYKIGETTIAFKILTYGDEKDIVYVNLHDDEETSVIAAKKILSNNGGVLIKLENNGKRLVRFRLKGKTYTFDPNRIFSRQGVVNTLTLLSKMNDKAAKEIEKFASRILLLFPKDIRWVVGLHNNKNGDYSIISYGHGNDKEKDALACNINEAIDPDHFFLTTDSLLFTQLAAENYNTVWENQYTPNIDGSLSLYCGKNNIRYLNCETEHKKVVEYEGMLEAAVKCILQ